MGPGKYDAEATAAREATGAEGVLLIVINGRKGGGFSAQLSPTLMLLVPSILRSVAEQIEQSHEGRPS